MKIAIISPYATVAPHFETELEIAQQHLDRGDEVQFLNCLGELPNCDFNPDRSPERCQQCIGRRAMGLEMLDSEPAHPLRLYSLNQPLHSLEPLKLEFANLQDLIEYRIENFDIGYAVLSSLVSNVRDPEPDLVAHRPLIQRFMQSAYRTFRATQSFIDQHQPDRIYVFNGRFAAMRAVFRAAESRHIECQLHERGCDGQHYSLMKGHLLHDIRATDQVIRQHWTQAASSPDRESMAATWFQDRVARVERNWHSFVKRQEPNRLPASWNPEKRNLVIFNSSEDEFVAIGDYWKNELYPDQTDAIRRIAVSLADHKEIHLTLRMHPNLIGLTNRRTQAMRELDLPNLTVIPPESDVDSYALVKASNGVVSFGSSVGIEAVYWKRPSVLLGPSLYQHLGGTYQPKSHEETVQMLCSELRELSPEGALMYGYWLQTFGHRYQYFQATGLFEGQFKGHTLYARPPTKTLLIRVRNELNRVKQRFEQLIRRPADRV